MARSEVYLKLNVVLECLCVTKKGEDMVLMSRFLSGKNQKSTMSIIYRIALFGLLVQVHSFWAAYIQNMPFTAYGTVTTSSYKANEDQLGFFDSQAFVGDNAYQRTIRTYGAHKFCVDETAVPPKAPRSMRIMSFNVHNFHKICSTAGSLCKYPRYAGYAIQKINPDIVALQEIVPYAPTEEIARGHRLPGVVAVDFSMFDSFMQAIDFTYNIKVNDFERRIDMPNRFMGKAIYTKNAFPIKGFSSSQIGNSPKHDRGYVCIAFEFENQRILLYNVHLTFIMPR